MRTQAFHLNTLKETPAEAEIVSHQLMLRAGMVQQLAAGVYSWLPLGHAGAALKVTQVVREEMDRSGALELIMPAVQPAELWQESGRWQEYGPELLRFQDRHQRDFCFGPTHEEVITDIARRALKSYRQLPVNYYQIQTKFRDEIRPRFGVMRAREFIMKDAYSFHVDARPRWSETYQVMYDTYSRIFTPSRARASGPWKPTAGPSAATSRTSSTCWPIPARTPSPSPPAAVTPPTSRLARPCAPPGRPRAGARDMTRDRGCDAGAAHHRSRSA